MILFFIVHFILFSYFNTTLVLLGADIFGYSLSDIIQTTGAAGGVKIGTSLLLLVLLIPLIFALNYKYAKIKPGIYSAIALPLISFIFIVFGLSVKLENPNLGSNFSNNIVTNKSENFYAASYAYYFPDSFETDIYADSYIGAYANRYSKAVSFEYIGDANFPFLHKEVKRDVLSPFFEPKEKAPNIVIILVEGLGRAFTNDGAYLGNFTPFLDSLSTKSLYWKNFMSSGGRTFTALPSILGSLPFANNGYLGMAQQMPNQISLLNLLKYNGYKTSFYYGGNAGFDNMQLYLNNNNIDEINDEGSFPQAYTKIPENNGFTWGYGDKELYRHFLSTTSLQSNTPYLSLLLTVSTHSPFRLNEPEKYARSFEQRMDFLGLDNQQKEEYRVYQEQYMTILFADDALKDLFENYKKRPDFENTIFLITGDHRILEIPMSSKIDRYHVPLLIYSPLLKRTAEISSVSSHFDIAPSLISYLEANHNLKAPSINSFIGEGLDTTRNFQNIHKIPLMQTKTDLIDFVMDEYHLNGRDLYRLNSSFEEQLVQDEKRKEELLAAFNQFKRNNKLMVEKGKIIPDSIYANFTLRR